MIIDYRKRFNLRNVSSAQQYGSTTVIKQNITQNNLTLLGRKLILEFTFRCTMVLLEKL